MDGEFQDEPPATHFIDEAEDSGFGRAFRTRDFPTDTNELRLDIAEDNDKATLFAKGHLPVPLKRVIEAEHEGVSSYWFKIRDTDALTHEFQKRNSGSDLSPLITKPREAVGVEAETIPNINPGQVEMGDVPGATRGLDLEAVLRAFYKSAMVAGASIAVISGIVTALSGSAVLTTGFILAIGFFLYAAKVGLEPDAV